jgi:peptidoglycan/xylan/chitin deacetylase (PgdA/CDA1 family)
MRVVRSWVRWSARVVVLAGMFAWFSVAADASERIVVEVEGRTFVLGEPSQTVGAALAEARRPLRSGALRSARTGRVLVADVDPPRITVNGRRASVALRLRPDDVVRVTDGVDVVEALAERQVTFPPPPLPEVEEVLWRPGRPRVEGHLVGEMSGEVVGRWVVEEERPPEPVSEKVVALTFDDGPDPRWTPEIMQILHDEGVPATFCVLAEPGGRFPELVRAQHDAGHAHCDHTVDHRNLAWQARAEVEAQIAGGAAFLESVDGVRPQLFRAPFGVLSPEALEVARTLRLRVLGWTVDSSDYLMSPPAVIVARTIAGIRPGAIVLLHDGGGDRANTVTALRPLIRALKADGYTFATPMLPPPPPVV